MQTERITYLTNAEQKAALEAFAKARGESVGNVVREATAEYMATADMNEEERLEARFFLTNSRTLCRICILRSTVQSRGSAGCAPM